VGALKLVDHFFGLTGVVTISVMALAILIWLCVYYWAKRAEKGQRDD
jgi:hypothetical protein